MHWLGRLEDINLKSLLATNGNVFVSDFRKTERLMKGMTFSILGCWLIVIGHTFRPGREWSVMPCLHSSQSYLTNLVRSLGNLYLTFRNDSSC